MRKVTESKFPSYPPNYLDKYSSLSELCSREVVSLLATFCWQKHYIVNCCLNKDIILFQILQLFRDYFSNMERVLLWKVSVLLASRRQFQSSRKILWSFQLSKSQIPCSRPNGPMNLLDALLCREDSDSSVCILLDIRATPFGRSSVFEKNPESFSNTNWEDSLQPSRRSLNKETREACYVKAVSQFTVRTLYASVRMPPRETKSVLI
jgi:hypothetical protein